MIDNNFAKLPDDLPVPVDDGACDHLDGTCLPRVRLQSTEGTVYDVGDPAQGRCVFFFYPRTGIPGRPSPEGWDGIPGARGCTPESCAYRDNYGEFRKAGYRVFAVSSQSPEEQLEFALRERIPYPILSDSGLELSDALRLPTFTVKGIGQRLIKRVTLIAENGKVLKHFYPVFPPDRNAIEVLRFLRLKQEAPGKGI